MNRLEALHYVGSRYPHLQGLRLLPLAIPFLGSIAWSMGWLQWLPFTGGRGAERWFFAVFAVALVVAWALGKYYQRRIGDVIVSPRQTFRSALWTLGFATTFILAMTLPFDESSPISWPLVVIAAGMARVAVIGGHVRLPYLATAIGGLILSVLGPLGVPGHMRSLLFDGLVCSALITIGISDHRLLTAALRHDRTI